MTNNSRIAIVGGGSAGSLFALAALSIAPRLQLRLGITVFERKDLSAAGPRGWNMRAGILSQRTIDGLAALSLLLLLEVVRAQIRAYQLHWSDHTMP